MAEGSDDHEAIFKKNQDQNLKDQKEDERIRGTCYAMCPQEEVDLRVKEKMVHQLEKCGEELKLVKRFARSAAGTNLAVPQNLRPYSILHATVSYLLLEVAERSDATMLSKYDFVDDRLRAVRQDMTIQRLSPQQCAHLLDPMIRFYVYFDYALYRFPQEDFSSNLPQLRLMECLNWFMKCVDSTADLKLNGPDDPTEFDLAELMSNMKINHGDKRLAFDPALMEALYILNNLHEEKALMRATQLPPDLKRDPRVALATEIGLSLLKGNFVAVSESLDKLCPLSYCSFAPYLPTFQRHVIEVLAEAFNSKRMGIAAANVKKWVSFVTPAEAITVCKHYGLPVIDCKQPDCSRLIVFDKTLFKKDAPLYQSVIFRSGEKMNLQYMLTH